MKTIPPLSLRRRLVACVLFLASAPAALLAVPANSTITAVTVYVDRAVVTRTASLDLAASGPVEIVFPGLPAALEDESLQVSAEGASQVTLLDVTARAAFVSVTPDERIKSLEDEIRDLQRQRRDLDDRAEILKQQGASLDHVEIAVTQPPASGNPRLDLDEAGKLLVFLDQQRGKFAAEQRTLDGQREDLASRKQAAERQLAPLRRSGERSTKTVTVRLAATAPGNIAISLRYAVRGARWSPSYDARVTGARRVVQLGYFGVVRQNTGEDWNDAQLTLSTARPASGGAAPELASWTLDVPPPPRIDGMMSAEPVALKALSFQGGRSRLAAMAGGVASVKDFGVLGNASGALENFSMDSASFEAAARPAVYAEAGVDTQLTSASFKIPVAVTIPSDNSPRRVPITAADLVAEPEYRATPKLLLAAFLNAKVSNTTAFPFIAGGMNVFLDGTLVASSALRTVMPGESFDLALGADEGIALKRTLNRRFTESAGIISDKTRVTYDFTLTIQNNKKTSEKVSLLDQVPVSRNEKIVVAVLASGGDDVKPGTDGTLRWALALRPGEKRDIPLRFSVEYPAGTRVAGLD